VEMIIRNNSLNYNTCNKRKVYLVDEAELKDKIMKLLAIPEPYKLIVTFGLISGLRKHELEYIHRRDICSNKVGTCDCENLHTAEKNGMIAILIMWKRGRKMCYYTLVPTEMWNKFRKISHLPIVQRSERQMKKQKKLLTLSLKT
jgi:intergrase/recombinase